MVNREKVALEHFQSFTKIEGICEKEFIDNYPFSCIPFVTPRKFWSVCKELEIVKFDFYDEKDYFNQFEKKLHSLIDEYRFSEKYEKTKITRKIKEIFMQYKIH